MGCGLMRSRRIGGTVFCIEETLVASVNKPWRQSLLSGQGLSEILHPLRFRQGGAKPFRCVRHKRARHTGRSAFMTAVGTKIGGTVFCIEETLVASVNNPYSESALTAGPLSDLAPATLQKRWHKMRVSLKALLPKALLQGHAFFFPM